MFIIVSAFSAQADGGRVLVHQSQGPLCVTVFVPPEAVRSQPVDVSVLVQWQENGDPILDANVSLALDPASGSTQDPLDPICGQSSAAASFPSPTLRDHAVRVRATREQASNKLLYAAPVELHTAGIWRLHVWVARGSVNARFDCLLPVGDASAESSRLWPFFAFPPIAVVAFGINQWLRRNALEKV